jgi:hypothetical protein
LYQRGSIALDGTRVYGRWRQRSTHGAAKPPSISIQTRSGAAPPARRSSRSATVSLDERFE